MIIGGFQKFSLLDYPNQLAAIVFTQGCNFRCPYCHNPQLVDPLRYADTIPESEVLDFLYTRKGKLSAVSITGGEPCLQKSLIPFVKKLKALGYLVKLDTNGSFPEVIHELTSQNLIDYWAMDVKAPLPLYKILTRANVDSGDIVQSMDYIRQSKVPFEFRTTLFEALFNWKDINDMRSILKPGDKFYLQQCRYNDTLEEIRKTELMQISLSDSTYIHLFDHPTCRNLIEWGKNNNIKIKIRSV